jgi:hypothetical protein
MAAKHQSRYDDEQPVFAQAKKRLDGWSRTSRQRQP